MKRILRKTLLYKSNVEYADFCINHVEGCSHDCQFPCYARLMAQRFGRVKKGSDWTEPKLVANALELLDQEIPKYKSIIKFVHLCFMTDPFMYKQNKIKDMTLKIIKRLNQDNIRCTVLTKGIYPKILSNKKIYGYDNEYGITLVSVDNNFKKKYEKFSAPYLKRIQALKELHDSGLKTWVSMEPYPPESIIKQNLLRILGKLSFVDKIVFGKLNYNVESSLFKGTNQDFYRECADLVERFCLENGIDYHIKYGTKERKNLATAKLFKKNNEQKTLSACIT